MVATLILERDENGDLHDHEGHLRIAAGQRLDDQRAVILDQDDDIAAAVQDKVLKEQVSFAEDMEAVKINSDGDLEEEVHLISTGFQNQKHENQKHENQSGYRNSYETPIDNISEKSEDAAELMQVDQDTMGRTLRKRKEKVPKHMKKGANDKEMESFRKRILRIPLDKPFEEAYFTHMLWMFFTETKETEEDIRRMFHQIGNALVPVDFHVLDINLNWNSSLLLRRAFMAITGYKEIGDNPKFIAACHCNHEADEESITTKHELSINEKFVATIDNDHANEINDFLEGSINSWENDYYQPCFAVNTATPSKMKMSAMEHDEYDDG
ncbi:hypothetical protein F2Q70_00021633 [Brassica cretica]|uniref:Uncharacterized protein n=1 Tax=Brassica cretica TaxID=69181 RepID=A0A8S9GM28_BRACR|nr:hypothetical protein F2Q70_00021633 [Brassica cretica]